jgi:hypothetical protein
LLPTDIHSNYFSFHSEVGRHPLGVTHVNLLYVLEVLFSLRTVLQIVKDRGVFGILKVDLSRVETTTQLMRVDLRALFDAHKRLREEEALRVKVAAAQAILEARMAAEAEAAAKAVQQAAIDLEAQEKAQFKIQQERADLLERERLQLSVSKETSSNSSSSSGNDNNSSSSGARMDVATSSSSSSGGIGCGSGLHPSHPSTSGSEQGKENVVPIAALLSPAQTANSRRSSKGNPLTAHLKREAKAAIAAATDVTGSGQKRGGGLSEYNAPGPKARRLMRSNNLNDESQFVQYGDTQKFI